MLYEAAAAWDASMAAWGASDRTRQCRRDLLKRLEGQGWHTVEGVTRQHCEKFVPELGPVVWPAYSEATSELKPAPIVPGLLAISSKLATADRAKSDGRAFVEFAVTERTPD